MIRALFFDYKTTFSDDGSPHPGADAFIRHCADRFPLLLTTDATRTETEKTMRSNAMHSFFLDIVCAAEVENPLPAPDLLVATLGRIGFLTRDRNPIEPSECLVVESSIDGIAAARAAHMRSLAIAHSVAPQDLSSADFVCDSFAAVDLDDILRRCAG